MRDDEGHLGATRDLDRLGDSLEKVPAVAAHVCMVGAAVAFQRLRRLGDLVRVGEDRVLVRQPRAEAGSALGQGPLQHGPHGAAFVLGCRPVRFAQHERPYRHVARQRGHVDGRASGRDHLEVLTHSLPRPLVVVEVEQRRAAEVGGEHVVRHGRGGHAAVADDERRHALPDGALRQGVDEVGDVGVGVLLDEAGSHEVAGGVDSLGRLTAGETSDGHYDIVDDGDVGPGTRGCPCRPGLVR